MSSVGGFFRAREEALRAPFIEQVEAACRSLGIRLTWSSDRWIGTMQRDSRRERVVGYTFGLNDSAAVEISIDKGATSSVLSSNSVEVVRHREWTFGDLGSVADAQIVADDERLPIVVKPVRGHSGIDVYRAFSVDEVAATFDLLRQKYGAVVVSPFVSDAEEYRLIFLDGRSMLAFQKKRAADAKDPRTEWRHNAEFGSTPEVLAEDSEIYERLASLARRAMVALGLRVGAVDILVSGDEHRVLEVNDAFTLDRFSLASSAGFDRAAAIVLAVVAAIFDEGVDTTGESPRRLKCLFSCSGSPSGTESDASEPGVGV
jgi:glutathione synthase/RimK-type ligase-like ATP-grasp enzyme